MIKSKEIELIKEIKDKNSQEAKMELYKNYEMLIHKIARQYVNSAMQLDYADLIGEGTVGFFYSLEKYDINRNVKFDTYAYNWIRERILMAVKTSQKKVYVPYAKSNTAFKIRRLIEEAEKMNFSKEETDMYIMSNLKVNEKKYEKIMHDYKLIEFSRNIQDYDKCISIEDKLAQSKINDVVESIYTKDVQTSVRQALQSLDDLEREIILALFFHNKKVTEVSIAHNIDKREVIRIRRESIKKLKGMLKGKLY